MNFNFAIVIFPCILACLLNAKSTYQKHLNDEAVKTNDLLVGPVKTKHGSVKGTVMVSRNGRRFNSFLGIPYGKAPVGHLRFTNPEEPDPWNETYIATENGKPCLQKNYLLPGAPVTGDEDCLFLNVYTHKIASSDRPVKEKNPVMVFIHGGGWFAGSGTSILYGPNFLMDNDVVLVTMNYRLGVLGYLSTGDDAAPGNWGQKDQLLALRWIQENIEAFGGDPNSVTLFGQSAGAASIHYQILSPLATGLFHRAISQSGSAFSPWAKPQNALENAKKQAQFMNCPSNNSEEIVQCLRQVDSKELVESIQSFKYFSVDPLTVFTPAVEKKTEQNPTPYIDAEPLDLYLQNRVANSVPWMLGTVSNEGAIRTASFSTNKLETEELNRRFDELAPYLIELDKSLPPNEIYEAYEKIIGFYMDTIHEFNNDTFSGMTNIYSDRGFNHPSAQAALHHIQITPNVYFYNFDYRGEYSYSTVFTGSLENFGVAHSDELIYLFYTPIFFPSLPPNDKDTSHKLIEFWTNFATYGDPTPTSNNTTEKWLPVSVKANNLDYTGTADLFYYYMFQTDNCTIAFDMKDSFLPERMKFLDSLPLHENRRRSEQ